MVAEPLRGYKSTVPPPLLILHAKYRHCPSVDYVEVLPVTETEQTSDLLGHGIVRDRWSRRM